MAENDNNTAIPPLSEQGQIFWNAYNNIRNDIASPEGYDFNRELLTYIQAHPHYLPYVDLYLHSADMSADQKALKRAEAEAIHTSAMEVLETSPGYSTDMDALAGDFYFVIGKSYDPPALPADEPADPTVVAAPTIDLDFARAQLGDMAEAPETPIELTTTPIRPEDAPIQIVHEEPEPEEDVPTGSIATLSESEIVVNLYGDTTEYEVEPGDNLSHIVRDFFGLSDPRDIAKAVTYVANINGMQNGDEANDLFIGQKLQLPSTPFAPPGLNVTELDWNALDAETRSRKAGLGGNFTRATQPLSADSAAVLPGGGEQALRFANHTP